jgi:hypothetical protein
MLILGNMQFQILLHIKMFHLLANINEIILDIFEHANFADDQLPETVAFEDDLLANLGLEQVEVLGY